MATRNRPRHPGAVSRCSRAAPQRLWDRLDLVWAWQVVLELLPYQAYLAFLACHHPHLASCATFTASFGGLASFVTPVASFAGSASSTGPSGPFLGAFHQHQRPHQVSHRLHRPYLTSSATFATSSMGSASFTAPVASSAGSTSSTGPSGPCRVACHQHRPSGACYQLSWHLLRWLQLQCCSLS